MLLFTFDPDNVANVSVKVSDFRLALHVQGCTQMTVAVGPRPFRHMAPELLSKSRYSEKSDPWAFGVTAWELLTCG